MTRLRQSVRNTKKRAVRVRNANGGKRTRKVRKR